MKLPSKVTSYKESTISKFPIILKLLKEKDYTVSSLYTKIKNKISIKKEFIHYVKKDTI